MPKMPTPEEKMQMEQMRARVMQRQGDVEETEDTAFEAAAPKGRFSPKALNSLVDATNRLLPLFGITDKYDKFSDVVTVLPPEFVRILSMFSAAISDAVDAGVLPPDAVVDLKVVSDDSGILGLAGRVNMAAKTPSLKRFLMQKIVEKGKGEMKEGEYGEEEGSESEGPMSEGETESLFASRM